MGLLSFLFGESKPKARKGPRRAAGKLPALRWLNPWDGKARRYHARLRASWKGVSGCYVIRDASSHRVLYVGESHTGALGDTCTRHFRAWSGERCTFRVDRAEVEVALVRTAPAKARAMETRLIAALKPRDQGEGAGCDPAPF